MQSSQTTSNGQRRVQSIRSATKEIKNNQRRGKQSAGTIFNHTTYTGPKVDKFTRECTYWDTLNKSNGAKRSMKLIARYCKYKTMRNKFDKQKRLRLINTQIFIIWLLLAVQSHRPRGYGLSLMLVLRGNTNSAL